MATPPSAEQLWQLGMDLHWPAITIGRRPVVGKRDWQVILHGPPPPVPQECMAWLRRLERHLLVATDGARERLRRWIAGQKTAPSAALPPWLRAKLVRESVSFYGDGPMLPAVVAALALAPAPVRAAVLSEVTFLGVGAETRGWAGSSNLLDRDGARRPRLVVLAGHDLADLERVTLHECAHSWLAPLPHEGSMLVSAHGEERLLALARREGWLDRAEAHLERDERLAIGLEKTWAGRV